MIQPDPTDEGFTVGWRVENGSALRIYVNKSDQAVPFTAGASIVLFSDVYPEYSGEYVVGTVVDYVTQWAFITTCIGTEFKQEVI